MEANGLSNKKLVEMFISTILKQNNIDPKTELTKDEKKEIKKMAKDIHNRINSFLEIKNNLRTENQYNNKGKVNSNQTFIDPNDIKTVKMFPSNLPQI